jgi:branched-chain amino acid transport system substrate-binding protein
MRLLISLLFLFSLIPALAHADTLIGLAGPFTGSNAAAGAQFRAGAKMAVADLNAAGGVLGQKIVLAEGDDACDPKQAVAVANELVGKQVKAVIGHFCSGSSIPASDVYAEENIVEISPASTNPKFTDSGKTNVFRMCGRDDQQGKIAAQYILKAFAGKKIAVVDDKSAAGEGIADVVRQTLAAAGVKPVLDDKINAGEKDYSALVTKLKQAGADLVYYGGYQNEAGLLVRQMHEQGMKTILLGSDALVTRDFWSITGADGEGTLMTFSPDPTIDPKNAGLVARFQQQGVWPEGYTLYTYAAFQAWAEAAEKAQSTDSAKVEAALKSGTFDTVLGPVSFDAKGDVKAPGYVVYEWHEGKYTELKDQ